MSDPTPFTLKDRELLESRIENLQDAVNEKNERIAELELELEQAKKALDEAEEKLKRGMRNNG